MPKPFPREFREDVLRVVRAREPGVTIAQIPRDFGVHVMMYPLVQELAEDGIPVEVSCRVLQLSCQPYYRWLKQPAGGRELIEAYRANARYDAHIDDPEFGHRVLAGEARAAGEAMADRTAWRICSNLGWWSVFGKKTVRGKGEKPGPAVHDDLVKRDSPPTP